MNLFCSYDDCKESPKLLVYRIRGIVKYSINVCIDHGKWAEKYLKIHLELDLQNQLEEGEDGTETD